MSVIKGAVLSLLILVTFSALLVPPSADAVQSAPENPPSAPQPPEVVINAPVVGETVRGAETVTATVLADETVTAVRFLVDGVEVGQATAPPWETMSDTTTVADGPHEVVAEAVLPSGAVVPETVTVTVAQAAGSGQRLREDTAVGLVSEEDHARFGVYRLFDPSRVPEQYRPPEGTGPSTVDLLDALQNFDSLDPTVQQELLDYLRPLPPEEPQRHARTFSPAGTTLSVGCTSAALSVPVGPNGRISLECRVTTARASIFYPGCTE